MANSILVEVIYALPQEQSVFKLEVLNGTTVQQAIQQSGILDKFPQIQLVGPETNRVGVWSKPCALTHIVEDQDRIEIYRPLHQSALEVRKARINAER